MYDGTDWPLRENRSFSPIDAPANNATRPIFLHGMWRSGSTYLWSRFRTASNTRCFYEPLHHGLAKLTHARIERDTPEQIGANRHPILSTPYFDEFAPLIDRRGVRGYHRSLAYDRYVLSPDQDHTRLERYISGLLAHAAGEGRQAVLGFNRTGLRLAWLRARFDAYHIHIEREPIAIWASYAAEKSKGNHAFFSMWLSILEKNASHPLFAPLIERLQLRPTILDQLNGKRRRHQVIDAMSEDESYFLIFYLWLACNGHARSECDLLIDTGSAGSARYKKDVAAAIAAATGVRIDLSGMRAAAPRMTLPSAARYRIEQSAWAIFPQNTLPATRTPARKIHEIFNRAPDFLDLHPSFRTPSAIAALAS